MIEENVFKIKGRISLICAKTRCNPQDITIVAVTKGRAIGQIKEAIEAGITDIGENRVQEALLKFDSILNTQYSQRIKWHMVGHLQTNKVKDAVGIFDLIQSIDSLRLAKEIDKQAARINKVQDILIEIKTSSEETKFGLKPDAAIEVIKEIVRLKNINIKGLMTIAPLVANPEETRPYFRILRELRDRINSLNASAEGGSASCAEGASASGRGGKRYMLYALSMGMTDDFQVAIEEGSNMVRLGRAIFE